MTTRGKIIAAAFAVYLTGIPVTFTFFCTRLSAHMADYLDGWVMAIPAAVCWPVSLLLWAGVLLA